jgi:hypothetical protein
LPLRCGAILAASRCVEVLAVLRCAPDAVTTFESGAMLRAKSSLIDFGTERPVISVEQALSML